jgi:hypothetical protein
MNDPAGVPSALGIETVEWLAEGAGGDYLTVRITGRWRRRRPAWSGQPMLLLDAQGFRHRFPAMPETPSLSGAVPGTWRISFSVPAGLAPELSGRTWLQFGAVLVPLPAVVGPSGPATLEPPWIATPEAAGAIQTAESQSPDPTSDPDTLVARRLRSFELAADSARRRASEAEEAAAELAGRVKDLEHQLEAARGESGRLSASLAERERVRRGAEQRAHAEQALRIDLEEELAARRRDSEVARRALGELAAGEERIRELEYDLERLRRRADEAEQIAGAAAAARQRAERRAEALSLNRLPERVQPAGEAAVPVRTGSLQLERALIARRAATAPRRPSEPPSPPLPDRQPSPEPEPRLPHPTQSTEPMPAADGLRPAIAALRAELEKRTAAEARLHAVVATAEGRLHARMATETRLSATLAQLRGELDGLRSALQRESAARVRAQLRVADLERELTSQRVRSERAYDAIEGLRRALRSPPPAPAAKQPPPPLGAGPIEPQRLSDAFSRLRETIAVLPEPAESGLEAAARTGEEPSAAAAGREGASSAVRRDGHPRADKPWLAPVFAALTRTDASRAGRLLLDLLPAQAAAYPHPVAYDLVLGEEPGVVQVTVRDGSPRIRFTTTARESGEVDFRVVGNLARVARLINAGRFRRRFGRGVARLRGDRDAFAALTALVSQPLHLSGLYEAGVRIDATLALTVVSMMIDPAWTVGERFTVAHEDTDASSFIHVRDGRALTVSTGASPAPAQTTIAGSADALLGFLAAGRSAELTVEGDERTLGLLRRWIQRAQSG